MHMKWGDPQVMVRPCDTGHQGGLDLLFSALPLGCGLGQITLSLWGQIQNVVGIALQYF